MGKIIRILGTEKVGSSQRLCNKRLCVDLAENIHIHFRDTRIEFSVEEWRVYAALIAQANKGIEAAVAKGYKEGTDKGQGKWVAPALEGKSAYFPGRLQLEENANGSYHLHWNELRIEMRPPTVTAFKKVFSEASGDMEKGTMKLKYLRVARHTGVPNGEKPQFKIVPLTESTMYTSLRDNNEKQYTDYRTKLLAGNKRACKTWAQFQALYTDIKTNGFLADGFFELNIDARTIGDGQHRASIMLLLYPELEVKITGFIPKLELTEKDKKPQAHPCLPYEDMKYKDGKGVS
jgi:hypothetical protein